MLLVLTEWDEFRERTRNPRQGRPPPQRAGRPACTRPRPVARRQWTYRALGRALMSAQPDRVTVVIATRNRRPELLRTLGRLRDLPGTGRR